MRTEGRRPSRLSSPTTWIALIAGGAVAGAIALAMSPAQAEAANTTAELTLTGLVDSNCDLSAGGTTGYVAPGGTVTIQASLAGASVTIPGSGLLGKATTVKLDSKQVASFVDTVTIDGHKHVLKTPKNKIVLKNVQGTHTLHWTANKVTLLPSLLGGITVPLNGNNVNLKAGAKLSWDGQLKASKNTNCGVQIQTPSIKVSAPGHTLSLSGVKASLPNPLPSITKALPKPSLPGGKTSSSSGGGGKKSSGAPGPTVSYTPPSLTVPQKVMSKAGQQGAQGGGGGGFVPPNSGGGGRGGGAVPVAKVTTTVAAPKPAPSPAAKIKANTPHTVASPDRLNGTQLPVLLAILAILALSTVTASYARLHLLHKK